MKIMKRLCAILSAFLATGGAAFAAPVNAEQTPEEMEGVYVEQMLDAQVPLDLEFQDSTGKTVTLGDYLDGDKPALLTLNYYACPMLCTLQLNGLIDAMKNMKWVPGDQFDIITVSFNPAETPSLAKLKKQNYLKDYGKPQAASGWHFLVGEEENIRTLTDAVGFYFKYIPETREFSHVASTIVLTPDGHVSRYISGVFFEPKDPQTLRLSLVEASEGKIGSFTDQVLLTCFHYDPERGSYAFTAWVLMQIGALLTVLIVAAVLLRFWLLESRRRQTSTQETAT